jgi:transposase-like protein
VSTTTHPQRGTSHVRARPAAEGRLRDNLADHLPDKDKAWVDAKLVKAFGHPDPDQGLRNAKHLAAQLDKSYPSAAASLREGLEEMFTVAPRASTAASPRH